MKSIISFSPTSYYWQHSLPESILLNALGEDYRVYYVRCNGILSGYCSAPSGPNFDKSLICKECKAKCDIILKYSNFEVLNLEDYIDASDLKFAQEVTQEISRNNFLSFKVKGVELGRHAVHDTLLYFKKSSLEFNDEEWCYFLKTFHSCVLSICASEKLYKKVIPDHIITYNSLYSVNASFLSYMEKMNVKKHFMHSGTNLSNRIERMMLHKHFTWSCFKDNILKWDEFKEYDYTKYYSSVTDHFLQLVGSKHMLVYSKKSDAKFDDLINFFNISEDEKVLVAALSSYDERFAVETVGAFSPIEDLYFKDQADWIASLIEWVRSKDNVKLIIRVHPRELPNKRDSATSEHAKKLKRVLVDLPDNVYVNWPQDNISVYDLFKISDGILNAWSSIGKEAALFGIPVLCYSEKLLIYPKDLNFIAKDKIDYFNKLEHIINKDCWSLEISKKTFDWLSFEFEISQIDLSPGVKFSESKSSFIYRVFRKVFNTIFYLGTYKVQAFLSFRKNVYDYKIINQYFMDDQMISTLKIKKAKKAKTENQTYAPLLLELNKLLKALKGNDSTFEKSRLYRNISGSNGHER